MNPCEMFMLCMRTEEELTSSVSFLFERADA